jgi:flagellar protein FliS
MAYPSFAGHTGYGQMSTNIAQRYQEDQVNTMSPIQLLVKVYDIAIESCHRQDRKRAGKAIVELISALNFEYEETANRFYGIYEFCMREIKAGNYDVARELLQTLRDGWTEAAAQNPEVANRAPVQNVTVQTQA